MTKPGINLQKIGLTPWRQQDYSFQAHLQVEW
jgi:hypothetical protein